MKVFQKLTLGLSFLGAPLILGTSPITHVIIIIQENRTVDNLLQFMPGANTQNYCTLPGGSTALLTSKRLEAAQDPSHRYPAFMSEYDGGANDGWVSNLCRYVPQSEVQAYYTMAETFSFANNFFQTNRSASWPAHLFLQGGSSTCSGALTDIGGSAVPQCVGPTPWPQSENPGNTANGNAGCDSPAGTSVLLLDPVNGTESASAYPCANNTNTIFNEASAAGVTWGHYQATTGADLWHGPNGIQSLYCLGTTWPCGGSPSSGYNAHVKHPSSLILSDIATSSLPQISYVTPTKAASDHSGSTDGSGPAWVASIYNAVCQSSYWNNTAIFVVWDDWGGWYDHVVPPTGYDNFTYGFRVPFFAISAYSKAAYITSTQYDFGSILKYLEGNFSLGSLGTADAHSNDFTSDIFNYAQTPLTCATISAALPPEYFLTYDLLHPELAAESPDDDK